MYVYFSSFGSVYCFPFCLAPHPFLSSWLRVFNVIWLLSWHLTGKKVAKQSEIAGRGATDKFFTTPNGLLLFSYQIGSHVFLVDSFLVFFFPTALGRGKRNGFVVFIYFSWCIVIVHLFAKRLVDFFFGLTGPIIMLWVNYWTLIDHMPSHYIKGATE